MTNPSKSRLRLATARRQSGSAYLLTLLAMVVLTVAGLSVSFVSQTERQLAGNERTMLEALYAADSGMSVATAKTLWRNDTTPFEFLMNRRQDGGVWKAQRVRVSEMQQISDPYPCNFCQINQGAQYFAIAHAVTAVSERLSWTGTSPDPPADVVGLGRRKLGKMVSLQPWQDELQEGIFIKRSGDLKVEF